MATACDGDFAQRCGIYKRRYRQLDPLAALRSKIFAAKGKLRLSEYAVASKESQFKLKLKETPCQNGAGNGPKA